MRWLMSRLRASERESGAVAVIVTVLFAGGVMLGLGALVVDVGGFYTEKAQLQNGADAAALAVSEACAQRLTSCVLDTSSTGLAGSYANKNANDGTSTVDSVCVSATTTGVNLPVCGISTTCPAPSSSDSGPYVQVQVSTRQKDGSGVLPPTFGRAVLGSSYDGKHLTACSRASFGPPAGMGNIILPITTSYCDWYFDTAFGVTYAPPVIPIATTNLTPASEHVLTVHGQQLTSLIKLSCNILNLGDTQAWNISGAYGWIGDGKTCTSSVTDSTYSPATGDPSTVVSCANALQNARSTGDPVFVPVYNGTTGYGTNIKYTLQGFAAFVVTGWNMTAAGTAWTNYTTVPANQPSSVSGLNYCQSPWVPGSILFGLLFPPATTCIYGYYTRALIPASSLPFGIGNLLGAVNSRLTP